MPATGRHTEKCNECQQWFTYPVASHHTEAECLEIQSKAKPFTVVRQVHNPSAISAWDGTVEACKHWEVHFHLEGGGDLDFYECQYCGLMWDRDEWQNLKLGEPVKRHPGVEHLLSLFEYEHLPPYLQVASKPSHDLAYEMADSLEDGIELTAALRHLLYAKDGFVRQAVIDHRKEH